MELFCGNNPSWLIGTIASSSFIDRSSLLLLADIRDEGDRWLEKKEEEEEEEDDNNGEMT